MSQPRFMSPEHVQDMNALLEKDAASQAACNALPRTYQIAYELTDGARTIWWTMVFTPGRGVQFVLTPPEGQADMLFSGDYWAMLDFMRKVKAGQVHPQAMPLTLSGDPAAYGVIANAFAAAQAAAILDTEIPQRAG